MSGHSKWVTTHRQKAIVDAKRGAVFTKLANVITIAAKRGGDPESNPSLRAAIDKAREANMPKDNIERAVKKGTGELAGDQVEELYYEGIIPPGLQVVVKCFTDNRNRSGSTVRHLFTKNNGAFGAVLWNFTQYGVFRVTNEELQKLSESDEDLELKLIDRGAIDIKQEEAGLTVYSSVQDFQKFKDFFDSHQLTLVGADLEYVAKEKTSLETADLEKLENFFEELEDNEDVNDYYTNLL